MINNKKIAVVLPAYNAEKTLRKTYDEIPKDIVDFIILTDDKSSDGTLEIASRLPIDQTIVHDRNMGYGANQKSCYPSTRPKTINPPSSRYGVRAAAISAYRPPCFARSPISTCRRNRWRSFPASAVPRGCRPIPSATGFTASTAGHCRWRPA